MHLSSADKQQLALNAIDNAIFIIGTMRSGTGFLGLRVNESENVVGCPFELRKIWSNQGNVPMASDICGKHCPELGQNYLDNVNIASLRQAFVDEIAKNIGPKPWSSKLRFLNKNPHLCNKIDLVAALFPKALFIWTIRDLTEMVVSLKNLFERERMQQRHITHMWPLAEQDTQTRCFSVSHDKGRRNIGPADRCFPGGDIIHLAEYWLESNLSLLRFYQKHGTDRILPVPQQAVFNKPEQTGKNLRHFLGLEPKAFNNIAEAIDLNAVGKWKSSLSLEEKHRLDDFQQQHSGAIAAIENILSLYN